MVNQFLSFGFRERAFGQVTLNVNIQESGDTADGHGGAVLRLDGSQVAEIEPLNSFASVLSRDGNVKAVVSGHFLHLHQGADLIGDFFTLTDDLIGHDAAAAVSHVFFFLGDQEIDTVERDAAVVTNDAAAAIGIRQTRNDLVFTGKTHFRRIGVIDTLIVRLVVFGENLVEFRIGLIAVRFAGLLSHFDAAKRHKGAL